MDEKWGRNVGPHSEKHLMLMGKQCTHESQSYSSPWIFQREKKRWWCAGGVSRYVARGGGNFKDSRILA